MITRIRLASLLPAMLLSATAAGAAPAQEELQPWSGWYNLPRTAIDVRYRAGRLAPDQQRRFLWQFRNRHPFAVTFEYRITFQHQDGDRVVRGHETLGRAQCGPTEGGGFVARQLLGVTLRNVVEK